MAEHPRGQITEDNFVALPDPDNIFLWYFVVYGLKEDPYLGGFYIGKLIFPPDYPWRPPSIMMISKSGRFTQNQKICLSISDYHPELWNPSWSIRTIVTGLISFFTSNQHTVGS
mmetsp:Transcript_8976/g.15191  ORF Transcript_8976/g.15191 Transcript_8976/m.15191 type:complete len:114 (+) Transcript_8976:88-429(+)